MIGEYTGVYVFSGIGDITIQSGMNCVEISKTIDAITTINLPASPYIGETHTIKDGKGTASSFQITVDAGALTIDGDATYVMNNDYQAISLYFNGSAWRIK